VINFTYPTVLNIAVTIAAAISIPINTSRRALFIVIVFWII
jgi:hypothetical protein